MSSFRWVKDGALIKEERNGSGNFTADPNKELKFYQGTYRCYASNELGTAESGLIEVITEREFVFFLNFSVSVTRPLCTC